MNINRVVVKHRSPVKHNDDKIIVRFKNGEPGLIRLSPCDCIENPTFNLTDATGNVEFNFQNRKKLAVINDFSNIIANHVNTEIPNTDLVKESNIDWSLSYTQELDGQVGISLKYKNKPYRFVADNLYVDTIGPSNGNIVGISGSSFNLTFESSTDIDHNIRLTYANLEDTSELFSGIEPTSIQNVKRGTRQIDIMNAPANANIAVITNIEMVSPYSAINPLSVNGELIN